MALPPVLASVWRGAVLEAQIRGHVAVVDASGRLLHSLGDPDMVTALRSCAKPIQAMPFVRRAAGALGATEAEVAIACGSHGGEEIHVETVSGLLRRAGLDESALGCGPQLPSDDQAARRLLASGGQPRPIHNNCSGKHAAMLATCHVAGWPVASYWEADHPCQGEVSAALGEAFGFDPAAAAFGIDGCGLPTYGVRLAALARGFASAGEDRALVRCQDAMAAHPLLVAGTGRFDTALLAELGHELTPKIGGAAVWVAALRQQRVGVALKLEAGASDAVPPVAIAVLQRIGALAATLPERVRAFARPVLRNWAGAEVGETRVEEAALAML
jgi:L-asparaginase II